MKDIPIEIVIAMFGGLYAVLFGIWRAIARIEKNYVEHDECSERREKCPLWIELKHIMDKIR